MSGEASIETVIAMLRRIRALLSTARVTVQVAHEIILVESVAKNLGVYDEVADEIEELKRIYLALYYGESLAGQVEHEQRFQRLRRAARRVYRLGRLGA
ncbi:hypothetical protein Pyrfu_1754 [Pyrolobus fumarii 1A]|uniref:Uncharacterized protein n=1 Tax=Pyrolobus fumarii (strain DSM 11204 / 1A) TaxID=694429 RepID=G0ECN8_PYRF1|nr:hypothetical protein [Pyrolobus fumarii]AEM39608.1 hypothetical protein Pyrfu_1754 [Pyrolobus fumarii 1A]